MKVVLVCLALVGLAVAELPSYIKPCNRDDPGLNKCFVESANAAMATFAKGDQKLQTPAVFPLLKHPGAKFEPNGDFSFHLKETDVIGLDTMKLLDAKVDFSRKTIWFSFKFDVVDWKGTYVAKALKEKDEVEGKAHIIFISGNKYFFNMKFDEKDNHLSVVSLTTEYDGKPNIEYHFDGIDKHPAVKAQWDKYPDGFAKVSSETLAEFMTLIFGQVFKAATSQEIFPSKA